MQKMAILQVADTGPLESLVVMLRHAGYTCYLPSEKLKHELRAVGCDTVLDVESLVRGMGYEQPMGLPTAHVRDMTHCDLYVDVKAHRNGPRIWKAKPSWPGPEKTLWYRINGGKPEHVVKPSGEDCGDEINFPCQAVVTPNMWYRERDVETTTAANKEWRTYAPLKRENAYVMWPPFVGIGRYLTNRRYKLGGFSPPVCLTHNLGGWGYGALLPFAREAGIRCYGVGSPDGLIEHNQVGGVLEQALCLVHFKSSDAPGYSLYEALASGCPVVCTRRLIWRNRMQELLIPGETCLVFDRETHDSLSPEDVAECSREIGEHIERLADPEENRKIGEAGRNRLLEVMWNPDRDGEGFREFMWRNYP